MKRAALVTMLLLFMTATVGAQLSLLPQIGFDRTKTTIDYNDLSSFSPLNGKASLKANLRMDYRFKSGHGPYIGIGSGPAVVEYSFTDPSKAMTDFKAGVAKLTWKFEGGYQYSFKPMPLGKKNKSESKSSSNKSVANKAESNEKKSCGSYYVSRCGSSQKAAPKKDNRTNLRLQPSVGLAYTPSIKNDIINKGNGYSYITGDWRTAFVSGLGFEFGKGKNRLMTVSFSYAKALNSNETQTIIEDYAGKPVVNNFRSSTSNWSMSVGVPFNLSKTKKSVINKTYNRTSNQKSGCGSKVVEVKRCVKKI